VPSVVTRLAAVPPLLLGLLLLPGLVRRDAPESTAPAAGRAPPAAGAVAEPAAVPTADGPELAVHLDERTLAPELGAELSGRWLGATAFGTASVDDVVVGLRADRLTVRGTATAGWTLLPLDLTGVAVASAGGVLVRIDAGYLGGTVLPGAARREVERALQDGIDRRLARTGLTVRAVTIGEGQLVAFGRRLAP